MMQSPHLVETTNKHLHLFKKLGPYINHISKNSSKYEFDMNSCPKCSRENTVEGRLFLKAASKFSRWKHAFNDENNNWAHIITFFLQAHVPLATEELKYITTQSKNMIMNHLFLATTAFKTISSIAGLISKKAPLQYGGTELKIGSSETIDQKAMTEVMLTLNAMYSVFIPLRTGIGNG